MPFGSWPVLVKSSARKPPRREWRDRPSVTARFSLPSGGRVHVARPPNDLVSPKRPKSPISSATVSARSAHGAAHPVSGRNEAKPYGHECVSPTLIVGCGTALPQKPEFRRKLIDFEH